MTKEQEARRQRVWQRKRKLKALLAFRYFMAKVVSAKGQRLIKSFFRKVARDPRSSPDLAFRATEWLANIERGILERPLVAKDMRPIPATAPPLDIEHMPDENDPELQKLLEEARGIHHAKLPSSEVEGSSDRRSGNVSGSGSGANGQ